jgi:predicted DNA binding CopG/RHH family protein
MKKKIRGLTVRFSEEDLATINQVAKKNHTWSSTWIRQIVIRELVKLGRRKDNIDYTREFGR